MIFHTTSRESNIPFYFRGSIILWVIYCWQKPKWTCKETLAFVQFGKVAVEPHLNYEFCLYVFTDINVIFKSFVKKHGFNAFFFHSVLKLFNIFESNLNVKYS